MALVILTMARSRSSMTAEIFRRHGVFFGEVHQRGAGRMGYNEAPWLKQLVRQFRPDCYLDIIRGTDPELRIGNFPKRWTDHLQDDGWDIETPWGAKVDAFCYEAFKPLNPHFVGLFRDPGDIVASCMRAMPRRFTEPEWERIVDAHHKRLKSLDIDMINTDKVIKGDYSALEKALEAVGLGLSEQIVNNVIDK